MRLFIGYRKSSDHQNVFAFASGKENEYSYESTFTDHWVRRDHSHVCTEDVFHVSSLIYVLRLGVVLRVLQGGRGEIYRVSLDAGIPI